ncbi:hypothetical protein BFJ63_vAg17705 [Fusarium oxysporum f. sp. narcissi]|uniref:Uncharacterized protein n=1 Tax=Fusarium oxysporum f. sp. narcissi TaxID=451672 RepID=A0A4Q2UZ77_FUSOX|nr:hypothetical protein BFJ63_vAg17705 [Fusarium oxysporum f. sp. narcissi]
MIVFLSIHDGLSPEATSVCRGLDDTCSRSSSHRLVDFYGWVDAWCADNEGLTVCSTRKQLQSDLEKL